MSNNYVKGGIPAQVQNQINPGAMSAAPANFYVNPALLNTPPPPTPAPASLIFEERFRYA